MAKYRELTPDEVADKARLDALRRAAGLTQTDLGARCGWTQGAINLYLKEMPLNYDALFKLADALDVSPAEISPTMAARLPHGNVSAKEMALLKIYRSLTPQQQKTVYDVAESYRMAVAAGTDSAAGNKKERKKQE